MSYVSYPSVEAEKAVVHDGVRKKPFKPQLSECPPVSLGLSETRDKFRGRQKDSGTSPTG